VSIRFGINPISWANDDMPELGGDTPLERILADIRDLGFEGVERINKMPHDAATFKPLLDSYGLTLAAAWYSGELLLRDAEAEITALEPHIALLKAMGSSACVFAETSNAIHCNRAVPLAQSPRLQADEWKQFGARLSEVADYVNSHGLRFAYHHHLGTVVERADDMEQFLRHTSESVGLTLDTGHASLGGVDYLDIIRNHPKRIAHVHCKDFRRDVVQQVRENNASFLDGVIAGMFTVPGDGSIDYSEVMRALVEIDYSGWIIIEAEQDPAVAPPKAYAEKGLATLKHEARTARLI